jgi:hypothetical protein
MSQPTLTTYGGLLRDIGYAGEMVDMNLAEIDSRQNLGGTTIDFGVAVARDTPGGLKAISADGDKIIGITTKWAIKSSPGYGQTNANLCNFAVNQMVSYVRHGRIYVVAHENVTEGDQALSITAAAGAIGGVTGGAAGAGRVAIPGATWETTTASGQVGIVRIVD